MRRWISCWAKPGQLRAPGPTGGRQSEDHGQGEQDQADDSAGPGGVPQKGGVHGCSASGQPLEREDLPVVAQQPNRLAEWAQLLDGLTAPDHRGSRQGVGVDAAGAGRRHQTPIRGRELDPCSGVDDVMHPIASHLPGPYFGTRTGQPAAMDGHDLVHFLGGRRRVDSDADGPSLWRWFPG